MLLEKLDGLSSELPFEATSVSDDGGPAGSTVSPLSNDFWFGVCICTNKHHDTQLRFVFSKSSVCLHLKQFAQHLQTMFAKNCLLYFYCAQISQTTVYKCPSHHRCWVYMTHMNPSNTFFSDVFASPFILFVIVIILGLKPRL